MYQKQARYLYDDTGINLPHNKQGWIQGIQELWYSQRKQTVERLFETAKENHGFRYTQVFGKARMEMKAGLMFTCLNLKKLEHHSHLQQLSKTCRTDRGI